MASRVQADATVEDPAIVLQTSTGDKKDIQITFGIFYAEQDGKIANRIAEKITNLGYMTDKCEFRAFGDPVMQIIGEFLEEHLIILWLASHLSLKDDALMKEVGYIAQHQCIMDKSRTFAILLSKENLQIKLPPIYKAYTPLVEDSAFDERIKKTSEKMKKKLLKQGAKSQTVLQSATTSSVATTAGVPRPTCDGAEANIQDEGSVTEEYAPEQLNKAVPIPDVYSVEADGIPAAAVNTTPTTTTQPQQQGSNTTTIINNYNIVVKGANIEAINVGNSEE